VRGKLPNTSHLPVRYAIELNKVETIVKNPASMILYVVASENDVQKQDKAVTKNTADPCLRSIQQ